MFQVVAQILMMSLLACASNTKTTIEDKVSKIKPATKSLKSEVPVKAKKQKPYDVDLSEVEKQYAASKSLQMDVKKSLILSLLERTDVYNGQFFLSGNEKLRLEFEKPVKSVAVVNGQEFWIIEYPPKGSNDKVRVLKSALGERSQSQVMVAALMGRGRILDHFSIESKEINKGSIVFKMKPTNSDSDITKLELTLGAEDMRIHEITYEDAIENKTKFEFSNIDFDADVPDKLFKYAPPKGAEINQL